MKSISQNFVVLLLIESLIWLNQSAEARRNVRIALSNTLAIEETLERSSAVHARKLVHENIWATLATLSVQFKGVPYGNIVSYSDGEGYSKENSTGQLFFYLTPLDAAGIKKIGLKRQLDASVAISMAQQGEHACDMDVEDPTCWKITLTGKVLPVRDDRIIYAKKVLFSKHPQMQDWPESHNFKPYTLEIENIILLDFYGGAKRIPVKKYYQVKL
ncbi:hypothetical protein CCR75_001287 [Bremia lactucae]|uniref:CREG-like beta-barrel domain-containing protein n=1 Tax=Bremia lactucae TaxID=4779 RepID=A0A976IFQ4_BRELC|nr:hypothetical protein CCR75_001287 [Bremia lactucae]